MDYERIQRYYLTIVASVSTLKLFITLEKKLFYGFPAGFRMRLSFLNTATNSRLITIANFDYGLISYKILTTWLEFFCYRKKHEGCCSDNLSISSAGFIFFLKKAQVYLKRYIWISMESIKVSMRCQQEYIFTKLNQHFEGCLEGFYSGSLSLKIKLRHVLYAKN